MDLISFAPSWERHIKMNPKPIETALKDFFVQQRQSVKAPDGMLEDIFITLDATKQTEDTQNNLWRLIMKSKATRLAIAVSMTLVIGWMLLFSPLATGNNAWAKVVYAVKEIFWARVSPFTEVKFVGEEIFVRYNENMYQLLEIAGIDTVTLINTSKRAYKQRWQKRIREDIVEVLSVAGVSAGDTVSLVLLDLKTNQRLVVDDAVMTEENRRKAWRKGFVQKWARVSPFTEVQYEGDNVFVRYNDVMYQLVKIEGIDTKTLVETSKHAYKDLWQKRITEDIVEVLKAAGATPENHVSLVLYDLETKKDFVVEQAEMTNENRNKAWDKARGRSSQQQWSRISPFTGVTINGDDILVIYEGRTYDLISLNDVTVTELIASAKHVYNSIWQKRIVEDMPEVLEGITGVATGETVKLVLQEVNSDEQIVIHHAIMTSENRREIMRR